MKKRNRLLAILLTAILTISMLPSAAFASEAVDTGETAEAAVVEVSSVGEEQDAEATAEEVSTVEEAVEETASAAEEDEEADAAESETEEAEAEEAETDEEAAVEAATEDAAEPAADQEAEAAEEEAAETAEAEETAEPAAEVEEEVVPEEAAETVEWPITLESKGSDYTVTASFDESAGFSADTKMRVSEIRQSSGAYQDYYDQALEAVQNETDKDVELTYARFFDITFYTEEGEVEPTGPVNVSIKYRKSIDVESKDDIHVLHFDDNEEAAPEIMDIETSGRGDQVNEISFEADGFSVYAVIGAGEAGDNARATVNFYQYNPDGTTTLIKSMYVKKSDSETDLETIIYDPGAGTVESDYSFFGWSVDDLKKSDGTYYENTDEYVGKDYTVKTPRKTIADVRDYINEIKAKFKEGDVLDVYSIVLTHYEVEYVDGNGVGVGTGSVIVKKKGDPASYTVNMGYATDETHNFEGWIVAEGDENIEGYPDNAETTVLDGEEIYYYKNGAELTIKGDIEFSVNAPKGNWLVFDENGKGATYNAPNFIKSDQVTSDADLLEMIRNGYTFKGWYYFPNDDAPEADPITNETDLTNATPFVFGSGIDTRTTIYAKWEAITNANYTVIIWKQNVAGNGYDFVESIRPSGSVGSTPDVVDETNGHVTGAEYTGEAGFKYKSTDQASKTIAPEGNTVVNVYWDRIEYTLRFYSSNPSVEYKNTSGYELVRVRSGQSYNYAIKIDETWHRINYRGDRIWNSSSISVNTSNRTISYDYYGSTRTDGTYLADTYTIPADNNLIKTITALYGADIRSNFPIVGTNGITYTGASWSPSGSAVFDNSNYISYIDTMQAESTTFILADYQTDNYYTYHVKYYVEALPNDTDTVTFNGKTFTLYYDCEIHSSSGRLVSTESEEFTEITGYNKYGSNPAYSNGRANFDSNRTISLYYTRKAYSILFYDGTYYDGNGNPIEEPTHGEWDQADNILYGASTESYNKGGNTYYEPAAPNGYVFEGWCIDDACTHPYTFTTMPEGGLTVYAKWRKIQYRVFLHPNAGTDASLDWGSDSQEMNFRVSYNGEISTPHGIRTGYDFLGWYLENDGESILYPESLHLRDNDEKYGKYFTTYDKGSDFTDPMDKWGNGATTNADVNRDWITKKFDVYAKWSKITLGADGIQVVYAAGDAGEETVVPTDNMLHKDNTEAVAGAAAVPPADSKKVFKQWAVQKWNGTDFEPTSTKVLPGANFTIHVEDAQIQDNDTQEYVPLENVKEDGHYTYTIQLVAEYFDIEESTPTHIPWYMNDGTDAFHIDKINEGETSSSLEINEEVDIQKKQDSDREGYTFLGWAKVNMGSTAQEVERWEATPDNWTQELTAENLFLYYNSENGSFYTESTFENEVKYVAADEAAPYQAMFAVWERIPGYYIYHSGSKELEFHPLTNDPNPVNDLTEIVASGYLYGGYYESDLENKQKGKAITDSGMRFGEKEKKDGDVYYLKEVPNTYLRPSVLLVYNEKHNGLIQDLYAFVNLDSEDDYSTCGVIIDGTEKTFEEPLITGSIIVTKDGKEDAVHNKNDLFYGMENVPCFIGIVGANKEKNDLSSYIKGGATVQIGGYYVTRDGIKVTGYKDRMLKFAENDSRYDAPIFTGWTSQEDGNTKTGFKTVVRDPIDTNNKSGKRMMVSRTLMISAPSDRIEYKITKVYDSGTEEQIVESGDYTGQITYAPKDGYMFAGWYQDASFTVPADFTDVSGDMTVYAKYVSNKDITVAFSQKSRKSGTTTFNATIAVKNRDQLENVTVNVNDDISAVLANKSVRKTGSGKNIKYTTQYKGTVAVKGLSTKDTFTASVSWTTPDGTFVTGANKQCTYLLGTVTVR